MLLGFDDHHERRVFKDMGFQNSHVCCQCGRAAVIALHLAAVLSWPQQVTGSHTSRTASMQVSVQTARK